MTVKSSTDRTRKPSRPPQATHNDFIWCDNSCWSEGIQLAFTVCSSSRRCVPLLTCPIEWLSYACHSHDVCITHSAAEPGFWWRLHRPVCSPSSSLSPYFSYLSQQSYFNLQQRGCSYRHLPTLYHLLLQHACLRACVPNYRSLLSHSRGVFDIIRQQPGHPIHSIFQPICTPRLLPAVSCLRARLGSHRHGEDLRPRL